MAEKSSKNQIMQRKLTRQLANNLLQQKAIQEACRSTRGKNKAALRQVMSMLGKDQEVMARDLVGVERDLLWKRVLLDPLLDHIKQLGEGWKASKASLEAIDYLSEMLKFANSMVEDYDQNRGPYAQKKKLDLMVSLAPALPLQRGEPSPFYPLGGERLRVASKIWNLVVDEIHKDANNNTLNMDVYGLSGCINWYVDVSRLVAAMLDGKPREIEWTMSAHSISKKVRDHADEFLEYLYEDSYVENKAARLAKQSAIDLQKNSAAASTMPRRRF